MADRSLLGAIQNNSCKLNWPRIQPRLGQRRNRTTDPMAVIEGYFFGHESSMQTLSPSSSTKLCLQRRSSRREPSCMNALMHRKRIGLAIKTDPRDQYGRQTSRSRSSGNSHLKQGSFDAMPSRENSGECDRRVPPPSVPTRRI